MLLSSPLAMIRGLQRGRCCPNDHIPVIYLMDGLQMLPGAEESAELAARGQRTVTLLEAANTGTSTAAGPLQRAGCELVCSSGGQQLWRDCLESPAVQLAGSRHFAAAALMDGTLQVCY